MRRILYYVTQDSLTIWSRTRSALSRQEHFPGTDEGYRQFDIYLQQVSETPAIMLVDVIEEEFLIESLPKLTSRDRKALSDRRLSKRFPRTPYRVCLYHGRKPSDSGEYTATSSAITNSELLDPWINVMLRNKVPLAGIFSVPHLASKLLSKFNNFDGNALVLTQHRGRKLRQVFLQAGKVKSARLLQSPGVHDESYGDFVSSEITKSRQYLHRSRLIGTTDELRVYMVADAELAERVTQSADVSAPIGFHFIDPERAARKFQEISQIRSDRQECLYLAICGKKGSDVNYAQRGEGRFSNLRRFRRVSVAAVALASLGLSVMSGIKLTEAWYLSTRSAAIEVQVGYLSETFRREHDSFRPIKADSHEMKVAVDTGNFILQNRVPVPWVLHQVGRIMDDFPDIQITEFSWSATSNNAQDPGVRRRSDRPLPEVVQELAGVDAELVGRLHSYDGDLRAAFTRIDKLAAALQAYTEFDSVVTSQYPIDARPQVSINGEFAGDAAGSEAHFRLNLNFRIDDQEAVDEKI